MKNIFLCRLPGLVCLVQGGRVLLHTLFHTVLNIWGFSFLAYIPSFLLFLGSAPRVSFHEDTSNVQGF